MSWNLKGDYVETCSCELMCPCNLSLDHGATYDFCRVTLVFDVREGTVEGTDIAGCKVALIADTPKVMTEGNWRVGVFVDEQATDAQFEKLVQVFGGQLGGPMAGLAPLIGEMLGVERAAIEVAKDGLTHRVRVGAAGRRWSCSRVCRRPRSPGAGGRLGRAGWARLVVDAAADGRHGPRAVDRPGDVRLVRQRLGGDDGGDDVPVGGSDGGVVCADEPEPVDAHGVRRRLPGHLDRRGSARFPGRGARQSRGTGSAVGPSRPGPDRSDPAGGGGIRADAVEERLPEQVPQPPRAAPRVVARRVVGRSPDG